VLVIQWPHFKYKIASKKSTQHVTETRQTSAVCWCNNNHNGNAGTRKPLLNEQYVMALVPMWSRYRPQQVPHKTAKHGTTRYQSTAWPTLAKMRKKTSSRSRAEFTVFQINHKTLQKAHLSFAIGASAFSSASSCTVRNSGRWARLAAIPAVHGLNADGRMPSGTGKRKRCFNACGRLQSSNTGLRVVSIYP